MGDDGADGGVSGAAGTVGGRAGEERGAALNFGWRVTRRDGESFVGWVVTHSTLPYSGNHVNLKATSLTVHNLVRLCILQLHHFVPDAQILYLSPFITASRGRPTRQNARLPSPPTLVE